MMAHGGSFLTGSKTGPDVIGFCISMAKMGYVVASINYRMGVPISFTGVDNSFSQAVLRAVQDLNAAIRWFRKNASQDGNTFRVDTENIFTFGTSAGGFMVLQHAYMDDDEIPSFVDQSAPGLSGGVEGNSGNPGFSSRAKALVSDCGAMGDNAWIDADENIPACLFHGDSDNTVPIDSAMFTLLGFYPVAVTEGSIPINERLDILGIEHCFEISANAGHVPYLTNSAIYDTTLSITSNFLAHFVCGMELDCSFRELLTGVEETNEERVISLYPNPATREVYVSNLSDKAALTVFGSDGKKLLHAMGNSFVASELPEGMYVVEIKTADHSLQRKRLVVTR
jgi:hypothetical protein